VAQARTTIKGGGAAGASGAELAGLVTALQHVAIGMAVVGADGQVIAINHAFGRMLGHERGDTLPDAVLAVVDPAEQRGDGAPWARLAAGEIASYEREQRFVRQDGVVRWGGVTISALRKDAGEFIGALAQIQDVTAQKAAEATMRENEARLVVLVEQLPVALYRQEPGAAGAFHYVSPLFEQVSGLRQDDLPTSFAELLERVHPDDRAAVRAADERARRTGEPARVQYRLRGGNGEWLWVDNRTVLMRDDGGRPLAWHGALLDITARVRLEASLRESEMRFRRAFEDAAIGMSLGSPDLICLDANAAYCRIVGRPREELIGVPFASLTHPDDLDAYHQQMARLRAGATNAFEIEQRYPRPDGSTVIGRLTVSAVRDETGAILYDFGQLQDITPYKAASAALRESEAHLRTIVEQVPAAVYRLEPGADGRFTYASPRFAAFTGLSLERREGHLEAFFARVHPDDIAAVRAGDAHSGHTGDNFDLEYRLRSDDGTWIWVHDRATLLRDEAGHPLAWHGILLDVTERKRLEASLRESEERFRSIFEGAGIGMLMLDPRGPILDANRSISRLLGYSRDELLAMTFHDLTHLADLEAAIEAARRVASGEVDVHIFEKRWLRQDGQTVWSDVTLNPVRGSAGETLCLIAQVQDITARKAAEAAMRESEARFRALVQNDPDVILIVDDTMRATFVSPSARDVFGVPPETLLGPLAPALRFIHPADLEGALARFEGLAGRPGAVATAEVRIKRRGQDWRWFLITAANRRDAPGIDGYLLNLRDITDRKEAALALEAALDTQRTAIAELEWLNQSKSRFLSTISHEFRTPLTAIIGYSEFLVANAGDSVAVAEDAAVIHREASRLNRMVDDVLLLDRVDAGRLPLQREPLAINTLVEDVVDTFRPLTERHQVVLALADDLHAVEGDRDRMLQAITNLVSNAVKYSPGGGEITIATRNHGDEVLLTVQDQGLGIAPADLPRVFDRFERVESGNAGRIWGTGLGLSIVREIAALHGGRVWVESEPGIGSTFFLSLPAVRG
jgi:PAS domain S-box-containing protein